MYWTDKFLFLRMYRTPPRYGIELSDKSRNIMQWAIATHMAIGFYMFSNSSIFTVTGSFGISIDVEGDTSADSLISAKRMSQPHVVLYIVCFMIILGVLAFTKVVNTFYPGLWGKLMCLFKCCEKQIQRLKEEKFQMEVEKAYSNNIYRELTIDDLRREYEKTATESADYKALMESGGIKKEPKAVEHMLKKYDKKVLLIKEMLNKWLK